MKNITDKFQFSIANGHSTADAVIALATGNIDVDGFTTTSPDSGVYATVKHHHNITGLTAEGLNVTTVLDDAPSGVSTTIGESTANITMQAIGSNKSIAHALAYLKHNPRMVKNIAIVVAAAPANTDKSAAFKSMSLASLNPFTREAAKDIDLQRYFSENQFQAGKINIGYAKGEFEWNDFLYWDITIAAGTTLNITIDFYPED